MLSKLVDLVHAVPELVPLFSKLVDELLSSRTKEQKLDVMKRATLAAAARRSFLEALPGR